MVTGVQTCALPISGSTRDDCSAGSTGEDGTGEDGTGSGRDVGGAGNGSTPALVAPMASETWGRRPCPAVLAAMDSRGCADDIHLISAGALPISSIIERKFAHVKWGNTVGCQRFSSYGDF